AATPAGTTYSSPGFVIAAHPSHRYKPFLAYSVDLYTKLEKETGQSPRFEQNGTLHLAKNPHRFEEFKRYVARDYYKKGDVCKTSLLTQEEVGELAPLVDTKEILGALYTSNDGVVSAAGLNEALMAGARKGGVQVIKSEPKTVRYDKGKSLWHVELADGTSIATRNLVNAAGVWANDIARLSGHELPMVIVEVQFADLEPGASIPEMPAIIDHDTTFYLRKNGDTYFFGAFDPIDKVILREDWFRKGVPPGFVIRITVKSK
ncbi:FAD dependent oxidoreductase, partial [Oesophagostomum dentatum]